MQRYALDLTSAVEPALGDDVSVEYGFILHDVGKIGVSDRILAEARAAHARGAARDAGAPDARLRDAAGRRLPPGEGYRVVRHHHERWDGSGYPDRLEGTDIPLAARIFAVADTLDAMTSDRPYRMARPWADARDEIFSQSGKQFDPRVVDAFREREPQLRTIHRLVAVA